MRGENLKLLESKSILFVTCPHEPCTKCDVTFALEDSQYIIEINLQKDVMETY